MAPKKRTAKPQTMNQAAPNTDAIYVRVSTEEQAEGGYGLDVQRQQTAAYASLYEYTVTNVYCDAGISGTKDLDERPQLAAALDAARASTYRVLILPALDRLARKGSLGLQLYDAFENAGIVLAAVKERLDTSTPAGRMMRTMFLALAELERDIIVERTTAGRNARGKRDGDKGGSMPYGYVRMPHGVQIDPVAAHVVRDIFQRRKRKQSLQTIADALNALQLPAPKRGAQWYPMTLSRILAHKAIYRGGKRGESDVTWPAIL
jgi:site-specific DNA recombinase